MVGDVSCSCFLVMTKVSEDSLCGEQAMLVLNFFSFEL